LRLLQALRDEPGCARTGGGNEQQHQDRQQRAKNAADAAGGRAARRRGNGFDCRHLEFDACLPLVKTDS